MRVKVSFKEYNAWKESLEEKRGSGGEPGKPEVITLDESASSGKDGGSGDQWVIEDGNISPLYEGSITGGSNPSIDELFQSLGVGGEELTTYQMLMGDSFDNTIVSDKKSPEVPVPVPQDNQKLPDEAEEVVSSSTSGGGRKEFQKKRRKPRGPKKVDINSIYFLMRAAQHLNPNVMLPWLSNLLPQVQPLQSPPVEKHPVQQQSAQSSSGANPRGESRGKPESTYVPGAQRNYSGQVSVAGGSTAQNNFSVNKSAWSRKQEDEIRLIEQFLLEEMSPGAMVENNEVVPSHRGAVGKNSGLSKVAAPVVASELSLLLNDSSVAPYSGQVPVSSQNETSHEERNGRLITPAKFLIPSIEPLINDFEDIKLKSLLLDNAKRLPEFRNLKKRRLPRSVFVEMGFPHDTLKRYRVEGDPLDEHQHPAHPGLKIISQPKVLHPQSPGGPKQQNPVVSSNSYYPPHSVAAIIPSNSMPIPPPPLLPALIPVTTVGWVPTTVMLPIPVTTIVPVWPQLSQPLLPPFSSIGITTSAAMSTPPVTVTATGSVFKAPYPVPRIPIKRDPPVSLPMVTSGPSVLQPTGPINQSPQMFPKQPLPYQPFGEPYQYPIIRSQQPVQQTSQVDNNRYISTATSPVLASAAQYNQAGLQYSGGPTSSTPYRFPLPQSYYPGLSSYANNPPANVQGGYPSQPRQRFPAPVQQAGNPGTASTQNVVARVSTSYPVRQNQPSYPVPQNRLSYPSMGYSQGGLSAPTTTTSSTGYQQRFGGPSDNPNNWGYRGPGTYQNSGYYTGAIGTGTSGGRGQTHPRQFNSEGNQGRSFEELLPYQRQQAGMGEMVRSVFPTTQLQHQQYNPSRSGYGTYDYHPGNLPGAAPRNPSSISNRPPGPTQPFARTGAINGVSPGQAASDSTTYSTANVGNSSYSTTNASNSPSNSALGSPRTVANVQDIYSIYNREKAIGTNQAAGETNNSPNFPAVISGGERVLFGAKPGGPESYPARFVSRGEGGGKLEISQGVGTGTGGSGQTVGDQRPRGGGAPGGHSAFGHVIREQFQGSEIQKTEGEKIYGGSGQTVGDQRPREGAGHIPFGHGFRQELQAQEIQKTDREKGYDGTKQPASIAPGAGGDHNHGRGGGTKAESSKVMKFLFNFVKMLIPIRYDRFIIF